MYPYLSACNTYACLAYAYSHKMHERSMHTDAMQCSLNPLYVACQQPSCGRSCQKTLLAKSSQRAMTTTRYHYELSLLAAALALPLFLLTATLLLVALSKGPLLTPSLSLPLSLLGTAPAPPLCACSFAALCCQASRIAFSTSVRCCFRYRCAPRASMTTSRLSANACTQLRGGVGAGRIARSAWHNTSRSSTGRARRLV